MNGRRVVQPSATGALPSAVPHLTPSRETLPTALRANARWTTLGASHVPAMVVHPERAAIESDSGAAAGAPVPAILWMHGRTASKELDPGRYLRWMRAGIGVCAVDLPGHGERYEEALQDPTRTLEVVAAMVEQVDEVVAALESARDEPTSPIGGFDTDRLAIGGISAGGMVALARLSRPHRFVCATVEATTGSWGWQRHRAMHHPSLSERLNPVWHLDRWRPIPILALHAEHDEWVPVDGQREFIDAVRLLHEHPTEVEFIVFGRTGAPSEHIGFGRHTTEAKERQLEFLKRRLLDA